jgi:hypothetical protein
MEQALRTIQPACVVCGDVDDLTTDHARPLLRGYGLEPGNAVRLCRTCNSFKTDRDFDMLPPKMANKIEAATAQFKEYWYGRVLAEETGSQVSPQTTATVVMRNEELKTPDPSRLLFAVYCKFVPLWDVR